MSITSRMVDEHEMEYFDYEQFHRVQYNLLNDYYSNEEEYLADIFFEQCRNEDEFDEEEE